MSKIYIVYEHHKNDKYIIAAGYNLDEMVETMIHKKANGPKELIALSFDHVDGSDPEEITIAVEGGALHKAASFRDNGPVKEKIPHFLLKTKK